MLLPRWMDAIIDGLFGGLAVVAFVRLAGGTSSTRTAVATCVMAVVVCVYARARWGERR